VQYARFFLERKKKAHEKAISINKTVEKERIAAHTASSGAALRAGRR
jgi:hypothetical protein